MKTTTRWATAILFLLTMMLTACATGGGIDLSKLPPIVIAPAPPPVVTPEPVVPKPRATLAFEVVDEQTGAPIPTAFSTCDDGLSQQANAAGYIAVERELGLYVCRFEADGYQDAARRVQLESNRQSTVRLKSLTPPEPPPAEDELIWKGNPAMQWLPNDSAAVARMQAFFRRHSLQYFNHGGLLRYCGNREARDSDIVFVPARGRCEIATDPRTSPHQDPSVAPVPPVVPPVVVPPSSPFCAMRESDPLGCVRQVAAIFPQLLQTNTYESCLEFTQRVLEVLGPEWGHVSKTAGESQSVPRGFTPLEVRGSDGNLYTITGVSHDAIKHRLTGQVVDLLGNASANSDPNPAIHGPARIQWGVVPSEHNRVNNPFLPTVPVLPVAKGRIARILAVLAAQPPLAAERRRVAAPPTAVKPYPRWRTRLALAFSMACHGADTSITQFMLGRYPTQFREANPVLAWIKDPVWFGVAKMGIAAGTNWGVLEMTERRPRLGTWSAVASGVVACAAAHHNARLAGLR